MFLRSHPEFKSQCAHTQTTDRLLAELRAFLAVTARPQLRKWLLQADAAADLAVSLSSTVSHPLISIVLWNGVFVLFLFADCFEISLRLPVVAR